MHDHNENRHQDSNIIISTISSKGSNTAVAVSTRVTPFGIPREENKVSSSEQCGFNSLAKGGEIQGTPYPLNLIGFMRWPQRHLWHSGTGISYSSLVGESGLEKNNQSFLKLTFLVQAFGRKGGELFVLDSTAADYSEWRAALLFAPASHQCQHNTAIGSPPITPKMKFHCYSTASITTYHYRQDYPKHTPSCF